MGTTTGVGFVPTPTQVEEYTHRLTGNKTGTVYTHTHTLDVRSRQPPEPTGSTQKSPPGSGASDTSCFGSGLAACLADSVL